MAKAMPPLNNGVDIMALEGVMRPGHTQIRVVELDKSVTFSVWKKQAATAVAASISSAGMNAIITA